ncbi:hypothetical protein HYX15_04195 [Candidatus Woesearchaeota archaeon]|nr:hypothetical protein [Candidatus Woesearchaeota archaeon]
MAEEKKEKPVTIEDILRHANLHVGYVEFNGENEEDRKHKNQAVGTRYASKGLENYIKGFSEDIRKEVMPWMAGLGQQIAANGGILPGYAQNALEQYYKNSSELYAKARVKDIVEAVGKAGYKGYIPDVVKDMEMTYGDLIKKANELQKKKDSTEEEKKIVLAGITMQNLTQRMYDHVKVRIDDDFTSDGLKSTEEALLPKKEEKK